MSLSRRAPLAGPALAIGGMLWIAANVAVIWFGSITGRLPTDADTTSSFLARLGFFMFAAAYLVIGVGLYGLFGHFGGRARGLGIAGLIFTSISMLSSVGQLVLISGLTGKVTLNQGFNNISVLSSLIGLTLLGFAALRAKSLPRWMNWTVIGVGLLTFPILLATPFTFAPAYLTDLLGFLLSGIALTILGIRLSAYDRSEALAPVSLG